MKSEKFQNKSLRRSVELYDISLFLRPTYILQQSGGFFFILWPKHNTALFSELTRPRQLRGPSISRRDVSTMTTNKHNTYLQLDMDFTTLKIDLVRRLFLLLCLISTLPVQVTNIEHFLPPSFNVTPTVSRRKLGRHRRFNRGEISLATTFSSGLLPCCARCATRGGVRFISCSHVQVHT